MGIFTDEKFSSLKKENETLKANFTETEAELKEVQAKLAKAETKLAKAESQLTEVEAKNKMIESVTASIKDFPVSVDVKEMYETLAESQDVTELALLKACMSDGKASADKELGNMESESLPLDEGDTHLSEPKTQDEVIDMFEAKGFELKDAIIEAEKSFPELFGN